MIQKVYEWYLKGNFQSEEEAFRLLDYDYKGFSNLLSNSEKCVKNILII